MLSGLSKEYSIFPVVDSLIVDRSSRFVGIVHEVQYDDFLNTHLVDGTWDTDVIPDAA